MLSLSLLSAVALTACAGGVSGSFRGNGVIGSNAVTAGDVKVVASKDAMTGSYTELGIARGSAPTAQQAVDQAKSHCARHGGNFLIMNTEPFQSGQSFKVDATCATNGPTQKGSPSGSSGGRPAAGSSGRPAAR